MNILIAGGTGFIGQAITKELHKKGHHVYILSRNPENYENKDHTTYVHYNATNLPNIWAVINLAGETLFGYWTKAKKAAIISSRLEITKKLVQLMKGMEQKPEVFVSGSAIGYYGTSEKSIFTEKTAKGGSDFLADIVIKWESVANEAAKLGIRVVNARFGIVLGSDGGTLPIIHLPVKLFVGGKIGPGEQWLSWIHINDLANMILFCIKNKFIIGPINITAPNPVRNKDFMKILADTIKRPYYLRTPASLIQMVTGEMSILITKGQYVLPQKALDNRFEFLYPDLQTALQQIYGN